jgi:hypothetical protein
MVMSLVGVWGSAPADATSYRFWSYWTGGSDWTFSSEGAARRPPDGSVDGWRFAISPASSSTIPPRQSPSFHKLCGSTPAQDGDKRVGLVVDFGTSADAPEGESPPSMIATCAVVPDDANGYEVLMTVAQLRTDSGLICGINGYPANECGVPVADPTTSPTQQPPGGGNGGEQSPGNNGGGGTPNGGQQNGGTTTGVTGAPTSSPDEASSHKNDKPQAKQRDHQSPKSRQPTPEVSDDASAAAATGATVPGSPSNGSPVGLIAGIAVIVGIGAAAFAFTRRRT